MALLGVLGAVAGIVQAVVAVTERADRKRRTAAPDGSAGGQAPAPASRDGRAATVSSPSLREPPRDHDAFAVAWRSALAYLLGLPGGLILRRSAHPQVRFHAAQSILLDIVAVLYLCVTILPAGIYASLRYPRADIPPDDIVMWTWALTAVVAPPLVHVVLAFLVVIGRHPRLPVLWRVASASSDRRASSEAVPASPSPQPPDMRSRPVRRAEAPAALPSPEEFDRVWRRITEHAGEEFRQVRGGVFRFSVERDRVSPDRTTVSIPRAHFARAWSMMPLKGPGEISRDVMGPSYVYAILTDPRIHPGATARDRRMRTRIIREQPFDARLHNSPLASRGRCSWHGATCEEEVVASVLTRDGGGDTWHAVCDRALRSLRAG
ncbi:hypothetical protein [Planobispora longispora]|uniref:hypothetical protein n=1 Tax=Planobispora longispora TaxID=28887 RepID=UPI0019458E40|nr:hypothetical protein [Planobispora longispora]